ncbi:hypothetical protein AB1Y20_006188 [Prymnesium parvum]|uniref:Uncharacterized protein n=1 Tax=Prymnesium parvum TaxID=97485 RepID=A0AB34J584_PRYPA
MGAPLRFCSRPSSPPSAGPSSPHLRPSSPPSLESSPPHFRPSSPPLLSPRSSGPPSPHLRRPTYPHLRPSSPPLPTSPHSRHSPPPLPTSPTPLPRSPPLPTSPLPHASSPPRAPSSLPIARAPSSSIRTPPATALPRPRPLPASASAPSLPPRGFSHSALAHSAAVNSRLVLCHLRCVDATALPPPPSPPAAPPPAAAPPPRLTIPQPGRLHPPSPPLLATVDTRLHLERARLAHALHRAATAPHALRPSRRPPPSPPPPHKKTARFSPLAELAALSSPRWNAWTPLLPPPPHPPRAGSHVRLEVVDGVLSQAAVCARHRACLEGSETLRSHAQRKTALEAPSPTRRRRHGVAFSADHSPPPRRRSLRRASRMSTDISAVLLAAAGGPAKPFSQRAAAAEPDAPPSPCSPAARRHAAAEPGAAAKAELAAPPPSPAAALAAQLEAMPSWAAESVAALAAPHAAPRRRGSCTDSISLSPRKPHPAPPKLTAQRATSPADGARPSPTKRASADASAARGAPRASSPSPLLHSPSPSDGVGSVLPASPSRGKRASSSNLVGIPASPRAGELRKAGPHHLHGAHNLHVRIDVEAA